MMWRPTLVFLWVGLLSFGGGFPLLPEMRRQLVDLHGWITVQQFTDGYVLGELAPGPGITSSAAFWGFQIGGLGAGLLAAAAVFGPGAILSGVVGSSWSALGQRAWVIRLRRALLPVGVGMMAAGVLVLARGSFDGVRITVLAVVVAVACERKLLDSTVCVLLAGVVGWALGL